MSYRQVIVAKKAHLSTDLERVSLKQEEHTNLIPMEDISIVVIDHAEVTFSASFFSKCAAHQIVVIICGHNHMPASMSTSIDQHYRPFQVIEFQIQQTTEMKEYITESLLRSKVSNQLQIIQLTKEDENAIELLEGYIPELTGCDYINREGTAAKVFFNSLYGEAYTRFEEDGINSAQNYGYAILRSRIARAVNSYGLCSYLGVNHCGQTNPYNLIYDLIEPFRPLVDYYIFTYIHLITDELSTQVRKELVNLLNAKVKVNQKSVTVQHAIDLLVKNYLRYIESGDVFIDLPIIAEINFDKLNEPV